jgi:hypothetical protein
VVAFPGSDWAQKDSNCQPPKQNAGKLIPTKKRNPCPICVDTYRSQASQYIEQLSETGELEEALIATH